LSDEGFAAVVLVVVLDDVEELDELEVVLDDDEDDDDDDDEPDFLLPYRSAPQPPPLSTNELRLTRRFIFPFAPHFSHFAGGPSPTFWRRSTWLPHFSHSYS
jgi:hypothetical protein